MQKHLFPLSFLHEHTPYVVWSYSSLSCSYSDEVRDLMFSFNFLSLDTYHAKLQFYKPKFIHLHVYTHSQTQNLNNILLDLGWTRNSILHWANTSQHPFNSVHSRTSHHSTEGQHRIRCCFMPHCKMLRIKVAIIKVENRFFGFVFFFLRTDNHFALPTTSSLHWWNKK